MQEELYAFERYKGLKIYVTEDGSSSNLPSAGQTWCAEVWDEYDVIHTEFSILSGVQALEKAKAYVDKFVDYEE